MDVILRDNDKAQLNCQTTNAFIFFAYVYSHSTHIAD